MLEAEQSAKHLKLTAESAEMKHVTVEELLAQAKADLQKERDNHESALVQIDKLMDENSRAKSALTDASAALQRGRLTQSPLGYS